MHNHSKHLQTPTSHPFPPFSQWNGELSPEQKMEEETCWRTNLFIDSEIRRVQERNQTFKKRTSFEENLVNDHLRTMKQILETAGLQIKNSYLPSNDRMFSQLRVTRQVEAIDSNTYLPEDEKWETKEELFTNQQNFSILLRLTTIFEENKQQLVYMLCKILHYTSTVLKCTTHSRKKANISELMDAHKLKILDMILNQETVKVTCPKFFSNDNEQIFVSIFEVWFYNILCIKNGVYEQEQVHEQQENFFD